MTVGLTYASGALTPTWAKLRKLSARSVDQGNGRLTSESHLDEPRRHSKTPTQEYMSLQDHQSLDYMKKGEYKHAIDATSLTSPLWVRE